MRSALTLNRNLFRLISATCDGRFGMREAAALACCVPKVSTVTNAPFAPQKAATEQQKSSQLGRRPDV